MHACYIIADIAVPWKITRCYIYILHLHKSMHFPVDTNTLKKTPIKITLFFIKNKYFILNNIFNYFKFILIRFQNISHFITPFVYHYSTNWRFVKLASDHWWFLLYCNLLCCNIHVSVVTLCSNIIFGAPITGVSFKSGRDGVKHIKKTCSASEFTKRLISHDIGI